MNAVIVTSLPPRVARVSRNSPQLISALRQSSSGACALVVRSCAEGGRLPCMIRASRVYSTALYESKPNGRWDTDLRQGNAWGHRDASEQDQRSGQARHSA